PPRKPVRLEELRRAREREEGDLGVAVSDEHRAEGDPQQRRSEPRFFERAEEGLNSIRHEEPPVCSLSMGSRQRAEKAAHANALFSGEDNHGRAHGGVASSRARAARKLRSRGGCTRRATWTA